MHIKKILTFLASAIIKWLPVGAEDIRFIGDDNLIYRIDTETVHAEILGVKTGVKLTGEVRIPEKVTYEGVDYTVDAVGRFDTFWTSEPDYDDKPCFYQQDEITSVYIPKTVKDIGYRTFAGCKSLKSFSVSPSSPISDLTEAICLSAAKTATSNCCAILPAPVPHRGPCLKAAKKFAKAHSPTTPPWKASPSPADLSG